MSHKDLLGTTSRAAIVLGMTNTDQVGMQQGLAPQTISRPEHAEVLPDAGDGADNSGGADDGDRDLNTGLTSEETAAFDAMRTGETIEPPADDTETDPADDLDGEGAADDTDPQQPQAGPLGKEKTPQELAAEAAAGKKPGAPKTVSYGKYQRELKAANKAAETAQAAERKSREDAIKLAERVAIINEALQAQAAAPAPVDPNAPPANPFDEEDIDPETDYAASVKQIQRRQRFQNESHAAIAQDVVESREDQEMRSTFTRDFQAMASTEAGKDLSAAYQFLKDSRLTEICISEFDKDPNDPNEVFTKAEVQKMVQIFNNEEKWVVGNAIKAGKSPSAAIMRLARARGFKAVPAAAAPAPAAPAPRNGAPRVPAPRAVAPEAVPDVTAALEELRQAQANGRSLSDGGGAPPQGLTAELLIHMSDEEFAEMVGNMPAHQLDSLMGKQRV